MAQLPLQTTCLSLIDRIKSTDPDAWSRLCQIYGPVVYGQARKAGLQADDAADVVQEVFASASGAIGRFDHSKEGTSFRGWLFRITANKIRDHFRSASATPLAAGGSNDQLQYLTAGDASEFSEESVDDSGVRNEIALRAMRLLKSEFEDRTWRAFLITAVDGAPAADAAAELGMSVGAVYVAKSRVLKRLRLELDGLL